MTNTWSPEGERIAHIDGDLLVYSGCAVTEDKDSPKYIREYFDEYLEGFIESLDLDNFSLYLTAGGNFRRDVYPAYKANRAKRDKPKWLSEAYSYLYKSWGGQAKRTYEADDLLGIAISENPSHLLMSYDKDLDQIPGWHHNWKKQETYYVSPEEANRFLAKQILAGDMVDNIPGIKGIGPKKADKLLANVDTSTLDSIVFDTYAIYVENGLSLKEFKQYYKCLKILREPAQIWPELKEIQT